jgi:flagellar basal-body rod protein FlgB
VETIGNQPIFMKWHGCCFGFARPGSIVLATGYKERRMSAGDGIFGIHATALGLRAQRMAMLASNIANAATPGYKARDLDFRAALDLASDGASPDAAMRYRVPIQPSLDGNTVELATEQTAFAENALAYRSSLAFLQARIGTLGRALKGE